MNLRDHERNTVKSSMQIEGRSVERKDIYNLYLPSIQNLVTNLSSYEVTKDRVHHQRYSSMLRQKSLLNVPVLQADR